MAWRCLVDSDVKVMSQPIVFAHDAPPAQNVIAQWDDGVVWQCYAMTVGQFKKGEKRNSGEDPLWSGVRASTKHALHLAQRPDRSLLLSLYEQSRQRLQVKVSLFGDLPLPQPAVVARDHPTLAAALKFMTAIAEEFANGVIGEASELGAIRDEKLKKLGLVSVRAKLIRSIRKRPAAAIADALADSVAVPEQPASTRRRSAPRLAATASSSSSTGATKKITAEMPVSMEEEIDLLMVETMSIHSED